MTPTFTVLIGSIGRPALRNALDSIARQKREPGDQCIVAFDSHEQSQGDLDARFALVDSYGPGFIAVKYDAGYHWLGVEQINHAMRTVQITGSHIFTIGDDDVFVDDAYAHLRPLCKEDPLVPIMYKFVAPNRWLLWDKPRLKACLISGCCIAAPAPFVELMHTRLETTHDYDWMVEIVKKAKEQGREPMWLDYVGVIARPDQRGDDVIHSGIWQCRKCTQWGYLANGHLTTCSCKTPIENDSHLPRVVPACAEDEVNLYA